MKKQLLLVMSGAGAALMLGGCGENTVVLPVSQVTGRVPAEYQNWRPAGAPAGQDNITQDPASWGNLKLVAANKFPPRSDPFALHPEERAFDVLQTRERVFAETGGFFANEYHEPPPVDNRPQFEEQPYRRLAGVIVGDSVLAIIEMGNGQPPQIIRPGQQIPNSEWFVVSIDEEKAVLRRRGNKLPREIVVRLESKPFDQQGGSGSGNSGGPGNQGGPGGQGGPRGVGPGGTGPAGVGGGPVGGG